jgi:hypothetical protein
MALRVDVRAKPHELGSRGGVALVSSEHERTPATLQQAQRTRSATISRPQLSPVTRDGGGKSQGDARKATERGATTQTVSELSDIAIARESAGSLRKR